MLCLSLLLLLTACTSRSVHVSPRGVWTVTTLRETLCYVDTTCVMSVSKSPLPFNDDFFWTEDRKQHLDYMRFVACI